MGFNSCEREVPLRKIGDESEQIYSYIITTSVRDHEELRGESEVKMIRTYRFRIYPDNAQIQTLESSLNLSCELYNAMLQQRNPTACMFPRISRALSPLMSIPEFFSLSLSIRSESSAITHTNM